MRARACGIIGRTRSGSAISASRSSSVSPGKNPLVNRLTSDPVRKTTSASFRRTRSARTAQSARRSSSASIVRPLVNGENQTSSPAAAACVAASSSRLGSPPVIRTALQCRSSRMTRISRCTSSASNGSCVLVPALRNPVSYVIPLPCMASYLDSDGLLYGTRTDVVSVHSACCAAGAERRTLAAYQTRVEQ